MNTVIITGASSGLGREYFRAAARRYPNCEFWLIARREEALKQTASLVPEAKCRVVCCDIASDTGIGELASLMASQNPQISLLINNAGFGKLGYVDELDPATQKSMVELNCGALTALCAAAMPYMSRGGSIINVASIAAFAPTPRMTVYSSTKAYVLAFSKGMRAENKKRRNGVNVLAVCPGPMRTEFLGIAEITDNNSKTFATLPYCQADIVAARSIVMAEKGRGVYTNKFFFKLYRLLAKLLPHGFIMRFSKC